MDWGLVGFGAYGLMLISRHLVRPAVSTRLFASCIGRKEHLIKQKRIFTTLLVSLLMLFSMGISAYRISAAASLRIRCANANQLRIALLNNGRNASSKMHMSRKPLYANLSINLPQKVPASASGGGLTIRWMKYGARSRTLTGREILAPLIAFQNRQVESSTSGPITIGATLRYPSRIPLPS